MFIVYDKNMNKKEFPQGVRPLDIFIPSIEKRSHTETIEGRPGIITKGQTHGNRPPIEVSVALEANDTRDYRLIRDEAFSFFDDEIFYVSESYQQGKRYKVTVLQSYIPNRLNQRVAEMRFYLNMVNLPYAESIGTTQDIQNDGIIDNGLWGYGMGLIDDPDSLIYTHNSSTFRIYNAGNVPIHPFEQELKITISNLNAPGFTLTNVTNGTEFKINEEITDSQTIVLDGPNITSNGLAFLRSTNKKFIELAPGWNEFEASTDARVSFDFPFYYK